jgi:hypothetical protein
MRSDGINSSYEWLVGQLAECDRLSEETREWSAAAERDLAHELLARARFRILQALASTDVGPNPN